MIINADEYGRSKGITDCILDTFDNGSLNSVSFVVNGYADKYAIKEFKKRKNFRLAVHIDLAETKPTTSIKEIPLLVGEDGLFKHSFFSLWASYLISSKSKKNKFRKQVKIEIFNQIKKTQILLGKNFPINIDSHNHMHMIPFIFDSLVEINRETPISYIRICNEPFFICIDSFRSIFNYLGDNLIKHILLKTLSYKYKEILLKNKIKFPKYFIGVLFTGNNTLQAVKMALSKIDNFNKSEEIEILFHPGIASKNEEKYWEGKWNKYYYYSEDRNKERETLKNLVP